MKNRRPGPITIARTMLLLGTLALGGCVSWFAPPPGIGQPVAWSALPGWTDDRHAESWPALRASCAKLATRDATWEALCREAESLGTPDDATARAFFERRFEPRVIHGDGGRDGLITGYYEPVLTASRTRTDTFRYPLYRRPDDLLIVDLATLYPELKNRPVRGRLVGNRVVPYAPRATIASGATLPAGLELAWLADPVDVFLLQVQGSGRLRFENGDEMAVGYADQNGHPYVSIGRRLVDEGALKLEEVSVPTIRAWLRANPDQVERVLNGNPSYIFFVERPVANGALGSLDVPLTPERSVAVDRRVIPLGVPVWLDTALPDGSAYRRLVFAQDTGGAIRGAVRADIFFGQGERAEQLAGTLKARGRLFLLKPIP